MGRNKKAVDKDDFWGYAENNEIKKRIYSITYCVNVWTQC